MTLPVAIFLSRLLEKTPDGIEIMGAPDGKEDQLISVATD